MSLIPIPPLLRIIALYGRSDAAVSTLHSTESGGFYGGKSPPSGTRLNGPTHCALVESGEEQLLFVTDTGNDLIRSLNLKTGEFTTLSGSGAAGGFCTSLSRSEYRRPFGIAVHPSLSHIVFVSDSDNHSIRQLDLTSDRVVVIAGTDLLSTHSGAAFPKPKSKALYGSRAPSKSAEKLLGSGDSDAAGGPGTDAEFAFPLGLCCSVDGRELFVCDSENRKIRSVQLPLTPSEWKTQNWTYPVTTVVGSGTALTAADTPIRIDPVTTLYTFKPTVDGVLSRPQSITLDLPASQHAARTYARVGFVPFTATPSILYIVDGIGESGSGHTIRRFHTGTGELSTVVLSLVSAVDGLPFISNESEDRISPKAIACSTDRPHTLFISCYRSYSVYICDASSGCTRLLAGSNSKGRSNGELLSACFNRPSGLTYCASEQSLFVCDDSNNSIRKIELPDSLL